MNAATTRGSAKAFVKDADTNQELIIQIDDTINKKTKLKEHTIHALVMSAYANLADFDTAFSIYSKPFACLLSIRKERSIENKTVVTVYDAFEAPLFISTGLLTWDIGEAKFISP